MRWSAVSDTTTAPDVQQTAEEVEVTAREAFVAGLLDLAAYLASTPGAPLPHGYLTRHVSDADDFDRAAALIAAPVTVSDSGYEHCERRFGPLTYGVQTDQQARRQQRIAAREAELGLTPADNAVPNREETPHV